MVVSLYVRLYASASPSISFGTGRVGGFKMCIHIFNHLEQNMKVRCQGHSAYARYHNLMITTS